MRALVLPLLLVCAGCSRYGEFTLPIQQPSAGDVRVEWQVRPEPVMGRGSEGAWDHVDTLNPSVVRGPAGLVNLYSGFDGRTWHTGVAVSPDGLNWRRTGKVLSPYGWEGSYIAANGSALLRGSQWLYWYQAADPPLIGLATSTDGKRWTKHDRPVMGRGPRGSWDERGVADPYVIEAAGELYMFYLGQDRARRQRLGVARSTDGIKWQKLRSGPILELGQPGAFDETGLGEPAVWSEQGSWWMLYTARDRREYRRLGLARSQDGVHWTRVSTKPVLSGEAPWMSKVVCDPTVLPAEGGGVHVWFGGGDVAAPAEFLNGQIGYAKLILHIGGSK